MKPHYSSDPALAAAITRRASKQTYYTIRFLVDKNLVDDAYRAYAYFRWVDDWLDRESLPRAERLSFVKRQQALIDGCYRGEVLTGLAPQELLLADLIQRDATEDSGLHAYICNLMSVMAFDAERRGRTITQRELDNYTHWLAVAVTEALHYFIGHDGAAPHDERRYRAVIGAHITHMLRDALDDVELGYYNIPREVMVAHGITPRDVTSPAYREWVKESVQKARLCFMTGRDYLSQVENLRCRLACYAYIYRFEVVLDCIEREGCLLRAQYPERKGRRRGLEMIGRSLWMALRYRRPENAAHPLTVR